MKLKEFLRKDITTINEINNIKMNREALLKKNFDIYFNSLYCVSSIKKY